MNVKETIEAEIAKLQAELSALPAEVHTLELEVWAKIKAFFHANPAATAPNPPAPPSA
jgi:hypothetical protein